ncbi:MAG: hypothetical protein E7620_03240 [Ruminococcaceae bacterium]|nr:hypothetical protein [Oscillospiraceae bacterium]
MDFQQKKTIKALFLLFLLVLTVMFFLWGDLEEELIELERTLVSTEYRDNGVFLRFSEEETVFVIYETDGTALSALSQLEIGSTVTITVDADYQAFENGLIQKLTQNSNVLFDGIDYNREGDLTARWSFGAAFFAALLAVLVAELTWQDPKNVNEGVFAVRNPRYVLNVACALTAGGGAGAFVFPIRWAIGALDAPRVGYAAAFLAFCFMGILLLWLYWWEGIFLRDRVLRFHRLFSRERCVSVSEIALVQLVIHNGIPMFLSLKGINGEVLMEIPYDGRLMRNDDFWNVLRGYGILCERYEE